jgi:polyhydroxyalkanoate synthesis regulator phasin
MHRKLLGIPLAGLLLVGGATAVLAATGAGAFVVTTAGGASTLLADVLSDLVDDGVINQDQADAITDAVDERREALKAEMEARREQMRGFLEDGVLSAEELAQLPEDHPLRNLDQYLEDGQLTEDELSQLRGFGGRGFGGFGPGHHGHGPWGPSATDDSTDSDATDETTAG